MGIERDLFALARAGLVKTSMVLSFIDAYQNEDNYYVIADLMANLRDLGHTLSSTDFYQDYTQFTCKLYKKLFEKVIHYSS